MRQKERYTPPKEILEKYADVLVNFALGGCKGIQRGDTVYVEAYESAKPLFVEIKKAIWKSGGNVIESYLPDYDKYHSDADFYELANTTQLNFFPRNYMEGLAKEIDHRIFIISNNNPRALSKVDPEKTAKLRILKPKEFKESLNKTDNK